jgi:hypothetical protein
LSTASNQYQYNARILLISYGVAITLGVIVTGIGLYAFAANGVAHSESVSAILATSRHVDIDALSQSQYIRTGRLPKQLGNTKLKFDIDGDVQMPGDLQTEDGIGFRSG